MIVGAIGAYLAQVTIVAGVVLTSEQADEPDAVALVWVLGSANLEGESRL